MKAIVLGLVLLVFASPVIAQEVKLTNGLYCQNGAPYTGEISVSDANGALKSRLNIVDGKLQGDATFYYPGGKVMETGAYVAGQKSGNWIRLSESGKKTGEGGYFNGQKHGKWVVWDENGTKRFEMEYVNGEKANTWYNWDEKGTLIATQSYQKM
jgi:antitoxin component YwqK of YwqJK toxin-antitoxin module